MNIPKLRFKEFTDEWNYKPLSNYVERITTKNKNSESNLVMTISAQYGLVDQIEFFNRNVSSSNLTGYYLLSNGDFAYNKSYSNGYPWGAVKRLNRYNQGVVSSLYICFKPNLNINSDYLEQYFETNKWYQQISEISVEGARNHGLLNIAVNDFFNTKHYFPSVKEQTKISNFLSLLDEKIELQTKKIEALKLYKKGLDKFIFSKDGLFIKDKFKYYFDSDGGTALEKFISEKGTHKIISIGNYAPDGTYIDNGQKIVFNNKTEAKLLAKNNLVMILNDKTTTGDIIGSTILVDQDNTYIYNQRSQRLICKNINPQYAWCFLNNIIFRKKIFSLSQGGTQIYINFSVIETQNILLPKEKAIETTITGTIMGIKNKLSQENKKLEKLQELKKGLMQSMFV